MPMKRSLIAALSLALALMIICRPALGESSEATEEPMPAVDEIDIVEFVTDGRPLVTGDIVATLGDIQITAQDAAPMYEYVTEMFTYYGYDMSSEDVLAQIKDITLDGVIAQRVYLAMAAEYGLDKPTAEEQAQIEADAQAMRDDAYQSIYDSLDDGTMTEEELAAATEEQLTAYGYDLESLIRMYSEEMANDKLDAYLTKDVTVTDEQVEAEYQSKVESDKAVYADDPSMYTLQSMYGDRPAYAPEGIRTVKHILITYNDEDAQAINELLALDTKPADYEAQYEALKQKAYEAIKPTVDEIMAKIEAGEDFDTLVAEYGEDPGMQTEPYISEGYMVFEGCTNLVAEFVETGMALEAIGDISPEPALTSYGAHIMMYCSDIAPGAAELTDDAREALRGELLTEAQRTAFNAAVDEYQAGMGQLYKYPENLRLSGEAAEEAIDEAIDETLEGDTLLIDGDAEVVEVDD